MDPILPRKELTEKEDVQNKLADDAKLESELVKRQAKDKSRILEIENKLEQARETNNFSLARQLALDKKILKQNVAHRDIKLTGIREEQKAQDELNKAEEASAAARAKSIASLKKLGGDLGKITGISDIGKKLNLSSIGSEILEIGDQVGDLSKNLGVSFDMARGMREHFAAVAESSESSRFNSKRLMEANQGLNQELGLTVMHSDEANKSFVQTTKYLGASAKAAGQLEKISLATGISTESMKNDLAEQAVSSGKNYGIQLSLKEVVEGISNIQGATLAYIADQPAELMKAVAISKKLGMSFAEIRGIADGMLDFQSSITKEVEAEVLLGRDINLNKARQLAFLGKEAELGQEILKQAGSLEKFNDMLPMQQEAFAQSLGMTRDKMAEVLMKQEAINKYGEKARDLSAEQIKNAERLAKKNKTSVGEELKNEAQKATATQNFQDAADKLKGTFQDIFIKLEPLITDLADLFSKFVGSSLGKAAMVGVGAVSLLAKAFNATKGTILNPMVVRMVGMPGGGMLRNFTGKRGLVQMRKLARAIPKGAMKGVGLGAVTYLAGAVVDKYANKAVEKKDESKAVALGATAKGLKYAGTGAAIGSMILPGIGTAVGAAIGAVWGSVTGAQEKREAVREKKREDYLKEKENEDPFIRELKMMRQAIGESKSQVVLDGQTVGTIQANRPYNDMNKPVLS